MGCAHWGHNGCVTTIETYAERGVWKNRKEGSRLSLSAHASQAVAVEMGRALAVSRGVEHVCD